jgi:hypothetical protein
MPKPLSFDSIEPEPRSRFESTAMPDARSRPSDAESSSAPRRRRRTRVVVKVTDPGYVPEGFEVAVRIDDTLFTALAGSAALEAASTDEHVVSLARARRVTAPRTSE